MKMQNEQLVRDDFVLSFLLGDDSELAMHKVLHWAYGNNAGHAYAGFLKMGRGFLWGPLAVDSDENVIDGDALLKQIADGKHFDLGMAYATPGRFPLCDLPAELRESLLQSVNEYQPKREVNLLIRRADGSHGLFIGRYGRAGLLFATPAEVYEAGQNGMSPREFYNATKCSRKTFSILNKRLRLLIVRAAVFVLEPLFRTRPKTRSTVNQT
jgi:hypothetical protein